MKKQLKKRNKKSEIKPEVHSVNRLPDGRFIEITTLTKEISGDAYVEFHLSMINSIMEGLLCGGEHPTDNEIDYAWSSIQSIINDFGKSLLAKSASE